MNPTHASPADDLAGAHRELLEHLLRLERAADAGPAGDEGELLALLGATRARLDDHFRFEEDDGYTRFTQHELFPSKEVLDSTLATGMIDGMRETLEQLETLVADLEKAAK